jgi:hypothetical protein
MHHVPPDRTPPGERPRITHEANETFHITRITASGNVESAHASQGRGVWTNQVRKAETQVQAEDALFLPQSDRTSRDIFMIQTTRESLGWR